MDFKKRKKSNLEPLGEVLGKSLGTGFLNFTAQKLRIFEVWPQVVGNEAAKNTKADSIFEGKLTVLVPGPIWMERYSYEKINWLKRLNKELGGFTTVEEIVFKVATF